MSDGTTAIRPAAVADAAAIAKVHVASTLSTYRGIMPDDYLDSIDVSEWEQRRRGQLADPGVREFSYVALDHEQIVGWAVGGPERSGDKDYKDYKGELYAIYLIQEHQSRGIGRQLTAAVARRLIDAGLTSMLVWVLSENIAARRFYEALGGEYVREQQIMVGGASLVEVAYGWKDLSSLA